MEMWKGKPLAIGDTVARLPIVQGGMGIGISLHGLASAVANEGGVGVISAAGVGMEEPDFAANPREANLRALRSEIRLAKEKTEGVLGVNIMVALTDFEQLAAAAMQEGIGIVFAGAGLPLNLPALRKADCQTKLVPIVSSARAFSLISRHWLERYNCLPDAVVVEGPMAGGHLGYSLPQLEDPEVTLESIVAEVLRESARLETAHGKHIPVIAGGGVYTGADISRILRLGAEGVQMATRFVATAECDASEAFKQAYVTCRKEDIRIINSPVGLPGRAIHNAFLERAEEGCEKTVSCPYHCISNCKPEKRPYCISLALINAKRGNLGKGFAFAGANAWRTEKVVPVHELILELTREYDRTVE